MHEKPCLYETKCVIMKGREYSSVYQVQFEKKQFEACYGAFFTNYEVALTKLNFLF